MFLRHLTQKSAGFPWVPLRQDVIKKLKTFSMVEDGQAMNFDSMRKFPLAGPTLALAFVAFKRPSFFFMELTQKHIHDVQLDLES